MCPVSAVLVLNSWWILQVLLLVCWCLILIVIRQAAAVRMHVAHCAYSSSLRSYVKYIFFQQQAVVVEVHFLTAAVSRIISVLKQDLMITSQIPLCCLQHCPVPPAARPCHAPLPPRPPYPPTSVVVISCPPGGPTASPSKHKGFKLARPA